MYVSSEEIWNKLCKIEKMCEKIMQKEAENNIEEVSVNVARRHLHTSAEEIKRLIKTKQLKARRVKCSKAEGGYTYKIKMSSIHRFQNAHLYDPDSDSKQVKVVVQVEDPRAMAQRILKDINLKAS